MTPSSLPQRQPSRLFRSAIAAALGGLLFGFDTAVISGTTDALTATYGLSANALGFTVASALIGTVLGSLIAGRPADRHGRKVVLFWIAALYLISAVGCGVAWDWWSLVFFRFIGGIGVGGASVVSPLYIAEISPAAVRGRLVALTQFNIVLGILLAFFSNYAIASLHVGDAAWRWMLGIEAAPALLFLLLLIPIPESPRWLMARGRTAEARAVLEQVGSDAGQIETELEDIRASLDLEHHSAHEPLFRRIYTRPILLAVAIAAFNQLSGINALMYYAPTIFKMAGAGESSAMLQTVGVGCINLLVTMGALLVIDHFGRRRLMLVGSIGYLVSLGTTAWAFYTYGTRFDHTGSMIVLGSLLLFIAAHAFGQGAVIWVFIGEVFPNRIRGRGQALGSSTHWVMAAVISWTFPIIAERSGGHIFAFYAVMMLGQLVWVLRVMPETKGISLEQIQKRLGIG